MTFELGAKRTSLVTGDVSYEVDGNVQITVHKSGRVLVNQTLQMTTDTTLSLIRGNTRADFSLSGEDHRRRRRVR